MGGMSAGDSLSPHQFTHRYSVDHFPSGSDEPMRLHSVEAFHGDQKIGYLTWREGSAWRMKTPGEIGKIEVEPEHRRQGVASGMFAAGRAFADLHGVVPPTHSTHRTEAGDAWARSVSPEEKVPPRPKSRYFPS